MSKPVRIPGYLLGQIDALAAEERRERSNMVQVLLEEALENRGGDLETQLEGARLVRKHFDELKHKASEEPAARGEVGRVAADSQARDVQARRVEPASAAENFRPDPKPEPRKRK